MIAKEKILETWIMTEHLSEGDIKKNDKSMIRFDDAPDGDYHVFFRKKLDEAAENKKIFRKNGGMVIYLDIFSFDEVIKLLRKKFSLAPTDEDIHTGDKFLLALYFNNELELLWDMTFFTASGYIRLFHELPVEKKLREYEDELKTKLEQSFDGAAKDPAKFNRALNDVIARFKISLKDSRFVLLNSVDNDATNLHSFYIDDLKKAEDADCDNLHAYLYGYSGRKVDLDCKSDSAKYNPGAFSEILMPKNYPLGRFPGNTQFALSFMQQVAVNLSAGVDTRRIRSVNGPPGTGKTTLLKDIFAELVVKQAAEAAGMKTRAIKGNPETVYYKSASLGELPDSIAVNSIVVASSNNGAVQNIVNELPLISGIDKEMIGELRKADYFLELSNRKLSVKWEKDESGKNVQVLTSKPMEEKYWGLFSLEGGRSDNMTNILTSVKHMCSYLDSDEFELDPDVYDEFGKQYAEVCAMRDKAQRFADSYAGYRKSREKLAALKSARDTGRTALTQEASGRIKKLREEAERCLSGMKEIEKTLGQLAQKRSNLRNDQAQLKICLDTLNANKPGFWARKKEKEDHRSSIREMSEQMRTLVSEDGQCAEKERLLGAGFADLKKKYEGLAQEELRIRQEYKSRCEVADREIAELEKKISAFEGELSVDGPKPLDMGLNYEELQLSNPWFGRDYRRAQSRLFIAALRVRKQFLYENRKNLGAAVIVWQQQNKHIENKRLIAAAWNWINFAIPVISSTFASFGRMCRNLGTGTLGHLFVDEAGQALPQAAVGAVLRSRHIMVVGDPSQIKPVLTLDSSVMRMFNKHFGVSEKYLSDSASVQTLVDAASAYGFYREQDRTEESWIGIPLWVHRRCLYPMFTISNRISYHDMMVQSNKEELGKTGWFNVSGKADNKYVREQGEFLSRKLAAMMKKDPAIADKNAKDVIYVITPFTNVAYRLSQVLREIGFTRYDDNHKPTNVGTIHTFQGKEAPIVFMVLGADTQSRGAASWAVGEPNMMNVAATRAKKEFYVVGDRELYSSLSSDVADQTIDIIRSYGRKHPELIDDKVEGFLSPAQSAASEPKPAPKQEPRPAPSPERINGKIVRVGQGRRAKYAYIDGDDGEKYAISEDTYLTTANADSVVRMGARISFVPIRDGQRYYAKDIAAPV